MHWLGFVAHLRKIASRKFGAPSNVLYYVFFGSLWYWIEIRAKPKKLIFSISPSSKLSFSLQTKFERSNQATVDLLNEFFIFNPRFRISASKALKHKYFDVSRSILSPSSSFYSLPHCSSYWRREGARFCSPLVSFLPPPFPLLPLPFLAICVSPCFPYTISSHSVTYMPLFSVHIYLRLSFLSLLSLSLGYSFLLKVVPVNRRWHERKGGR